MKKAEELRKDKQLKRVLLEVHNYDDDLKAVKTEHTEDSENDILNEGHLGGNNYSEDIDIDANSADGIYSKVSADSAHISEMNLGLPVFKVDDKVEIVLTSELSGDNLEKMDIKNKNKSGIIKDVLDGDRYVVDFDGTEIELHANELKIYDETVKRVNVSVQPKDVRRMQNAMDGVVEEDNNKTMLSNGVAHTENIGLKPEEISEIVRGTDEPNKLDEKAEEDEKKDTTD